MFSLVRKIAWLFHVEKTKKYIVSHSVVLDVGSLERKEQKDLQLC